MHRLKLVVYDEGRKNMENNMFKDYLESYIRVHNELVDIGKLDYSKEIENLKLEIQMNDTIVRNFLDSESENLTENERRERFEEKSRQYMENIREKEKELQGLEQQQERKLQLEKTLKAIRDRAKGKKIKENMPLNEEYDNCKKEIEVIKKQLLKLSEEIHDEEAEKKTDFEGQFAKQKKFVERYKLVEKLENKQEEEKALSKRFVTDKANRDYLAFKKQLDAIDKTKGKVEIKEEKQDEKVSKRPEQSRKGQEGSEQGKNGKEGQEQGKNGQEGQEQGGNGTRPDFYPPAVKVPLQLKVKNIYISEENEVAYVETSDGNTHRASWMDEAKRAKKDNYKELNINEMCEEIAGGRREGYFLRRKLNPTIIHVLKKYDNKEEIKEYITCLYEKNKELPFELTHDLKNSKLGFIGRWVARRQAKAENEIPGTKIIEDKKKRRFWNKSKAIEPTKEQTIERIDSLDGYRNIIDQKTQAETAEKILKEQEAERAKQVQEAMRDDDQQQEETK